MKPRAPVNARPPEPDAPSTILPPHDEDAERFVIGSLLIDPDQVLPVAKLVTPEDFYITANMLVFAAILQLTADKKAVDIFTVATQLEHMQQPAHIEAQLGNLNAYVGGEAELSNYTNEVPTALNATTYASVVAECATRRRMITAASEIARMAYDRRTPLKTGIERASSAWGKAVASTNNANRLTHPQAIDQWFIEFSAFMESGQLPGIKTAYPTLNGITGGWRDSKFILVTGPTGGGKTSFLKSAAMHAANLGLHVGIWTLEMNEVDYVAAEVSEHASIDLMPESLLKIGKDRREHVVARVQHEIESLKRLPIHLYYRPGLRMDQFALEAQMLKRAGQLDLIIFDYLQLAHPPHGFVGNREQEVAYVANTFKEVLGELGVPGLAGAQLNSEGELRESKAIEMASDTHIKLDPSKPKPNTKGQLMQQIKVDTPKNRGGAKRQFVIVHNMSHRTMGEIDASTPATPVA